MNEKFKHLDINNEKINRIINCALEEFSKNYFEKASTNNIVKAANVSRGLLYHYFTDKQELYDFLKEFSVVQLYEAFHKNFDWEETDLFSRLRQSLRIKFDVYLKFPYLMDFYINNLNKETIEEMKNDVLLSDPNTSNIRNRIFLENINLSKFKEDVDIDKAINVIRWTLQHFSEEYQEKVRSTETVLDIGAFYEEGDKYIEFLKDLFYK